MILNRFSTILCINRIPTKLNIIQQSLLKVSPFWRKMENSIEIENKNCKLHQFQCKINNQSISPMKKKDEEIPFDDPDTMPLTQIRYRSFIKLALMILNICFSSFYFGYTMGYFGSFNFHTIMIKFHVSITQETAKGLLQGMVPVGGGVGAATSFLILKYFSRRNSLLVVNLLAIGCGLLLFIPNQVTLFFARFLQGVCVGFYSAIAPLIIKELSPNQLSGTFGSFNQLIIAFGVFFSFLLQYILTQIWNNKEGDFLLIMFGFTLITVVAQSLILLFVYKFETPKYLLLNNQEQQCRALLHQIYYDEFVDEIMDEKAKDLGLKVSADHENKQSILSQTGTGIVSSKSCNLRFVVSINLALLQQFVGINAVIMYGTEIVEKVWPSQKKLIPAILNLEQTLACLVTSYLLLKLGRKQILQFGTLTGIFSLLLISIGFLLTSHSTLSDVFILIGLVIFMANFGLSLGPIVWLYVPEILEPNKIPFSTMANWASASVIVILFPIFKKAMNTPAYLFLFFAAYCSVGFLFNQKYVIETKGKTQKIIYDEYRALSD